jgi:hypothetical protein
VGLGWTRAGRGERPDPVSPLPIGRRLAFAAEGARSCTGVRRAGRRTPCPTAAAIAATATGAQCAECARLDRSRSVAADTASDDPRPFDVYLAYFGPGLLKVGITAAERGSVRLLEQAAVAHCRLGSGPLMAARRAEALLGAALGVKDRIPTAAKRAARATLPPPAERTAVLAELHACAQALPGWPEALTPTAFECADHTAVFGLATPPAPDAEVAYLQPGSVVAGTLLAAAGPDLYLRSGHRTLLLDARLTAGRPLRAVDPEARTTALVRPVAGVQGDLF